MFKTRIPAVEAKPSTGTNPQSHSTKRFGFNKVTTHLPAKGSSQRVPGLQGRVEQTQHVQTSLQQSSIRLLLTQQLQLGAGLVQHTDGGSSCGWAVMLEHANLQQQLISTSKQMKLVGF